MSQYQSYLNFDLLLNDLGEHYQVTLIDSPSGQGHHDFTLPFSELELENFILRVGQNRGGVRSLAVETVDTFSIKKLGGDLYNCVFGGEIAERFRASQAIARQERKGLRIRLRLSSAPKLIDVPWELLFDVANNNYIGLSVNTPIIRKLDLASLPSVQQISDTLKVLVMISSPEGYVPLDVEREWQRVNLATQKLQDSGRITLTRVEPSLAALQRQLRQDEYHIFHYIGHGGFDRNENDGVLVLEGENKKGHVVSGQYLGAILYDAISIQLALLNSCNGGRTSVTDPFAGIGQSLLQRGIPAVIAMQFEITDDAAITFSQEFYSALVDGYPVDASVTEARKMIFAQANQLEWATPVLYTSIEGGVLLQNQKVRGGKPGNTHVKDIIEDKEKNTSSDKVNKQDIKHDLIERKSDTVSDSDESRFPPKTKEDDPDSFIRVNLCYGGTFYLGDLQLQIFLDGKKIGLGYMKKGFEISTETTSGRHELRIEPVSSIMKKLSSTAGGSGYNTLPVEFDLSGSYEVKIGYNRIAGDWMVENIYML